MIIATQVKTERNRKGKSCRYRWKRWHRTDLDVHLRRLCFQLFKSSHLE